MIKKISTLVLALSVAFSSFCVFADTVADRIYVSPNGNDSNSGYSVENALKTFAKAKEKAKEVKKLNRNKPIEVIFKEGTYRFDLTVSFDANDSGTKENEITYKGADGEKVVFTTSKELDTSKFEKVKDSTILSRLPESARGNVYRLDLSEQGVSQLSTFEPPAEHLLEDVNFYVNGEEQTPAQWPNGEGNYVIYSSVVSKGSSDGDGGTISYTDTAPNHWTTAKDFYIEGFFGQDYRCDRYLVKKVDTTNKYLQLADGKTISDSSCSKRFRAINLLEELDVPGEWYIDRENMVLYYYPVCNMQNAIFEINECDKSIISVSKCKYLNFENISFERIRANAINASDSDSIDVRNCVFKYVNRGISYSGVNGTGDGRTDQETGTSYKNLRNGVYNSLIENNTFAYTSKQALFITGGNRDTLTASGNVIKNNYFYKCANVQRSLPVVKMAYGCGDVFENNIINNATFHAVTYTGNNYVIKDNEIYNADREVSDAGMIYTGYSFTERGTVIEHNYLHDGNPVDSRISISNNGIYWDDTINGQTAKNNIFKNIQRAICANGAQDHTVTGNTFLNCNYAYHLNDQFLGNDSIETLQSKGYTSVAENEYYKTAYPNMATLRTDNYMGQVAFNTVKDNILYNSGKFLAKNFNTSIISSLNYATKYSNVNENNTETKTEPTVDLSGIGFESGVTPKEIYGNFSLVYPKNKSNTENVTYFSWKNAIGADKYKIIIAKDKDFSEKIVEKEVNYNYYYPDIEFAENTVYYWKVYAVNTSNSLEKTWECTEIFKFDTTPGKTEVDRSLIKRDFNKIALDCNSIMYIKAGDFAYSDDAYWNYINSCRWNATYVDKLQMRPLVSESGILASEKTGVQYDFSCVLKDANSASAKVTTEDKYVVDMSNLKYSSINFVATTRGQQGTSENWAGYDVENYKITVTYSDGTTEDKTVTIYGHAKNNDSVITSTKCVCGICAEQHETFNMFEYSLFVDSTKKVKSITFCENQTPISIFAVTGVLKDNVITAFDISEYCNSVATATQDRHTHKSELDLIAQNYMFDETAILSKLDSEYKIFTKDIGYKMDNLKNEKRAICQNTPTTVLTSDESYSKIGFVAGSYLYSGTIDDYPVTLTYTDGTTEEKTVKIGSNNVDTEDCDSLMGNVQARIYSTGNIAVGARLYSVTVSVNENKLLKSVTFGKDGYEKNRIFVFAVSGLGTGNFEMYDYCVKNFYDEKLESLSGHENETVTISFLSKTYEPYQLMLAQYENKKFKNITIKDCDGGIKRIELEYTVPDSSVDEIKGFLWKLDFLNPLHSDLKLK